MTVRTFVVVLAFGGLLRAQGVLLPAHFVPNSLAKFVATATALPKDEFETTEAYRGRLSKVVLPIAKFELDHPTLKYRYDADQRVYFIEFYEGMPPLSGPSASKRDLQVHYERVETGKHLASNALGAKVLVTDAKVTTYDIVWGTATTHFQKQIMTIAMPASEAQTMKNRLRTLVVCTGVHPVEVRREVFEAKISQPFEGTMTRYFIPVDGVEVWVYDDQTGEVLGTLPLSQ